MAAIPLVAVGAHYLRLAVVIIAGIDRLLAGSALSPPALSMVWLAGLPNQRTHLISREKRGWRTTAISVFHGMQTAKQKRGTGSTLRPTWMRQCRLGQIANVERIIAIEQGKEIRQRLKVYKTVLAGSQIGLVEHVFDH